MNGIKFVPVILFFVGATLACAWFFGAASPAEDLRVPAVNNVAGPTSGAKLVGQLTKGPGSASADPGAWPCFRGPALDGISHETVPLARTWPEGAPKRLWSVDVGDGYAGPSVLNGRVYLMDYDVKQRRDAIRCLSLADGQEIWRYSYPVVVKRNHGMSRTSPAVTDKYLVAMGPKCHVTCLDPQSGELRWNIDLVGEYKASVPQWYAGQCPLIEKDRAIIAPGGPDCLMMSVDCATGKVLWKTPNPHKWLMTHVSILPLEFKGKRMYVYCGSGGVAGVSAEDGAILWETTEWKITIATVCTPIDIGDGRIFFSGGYNAGCAMMQLQEDDGKFSSKVLWRLPESKFGATQETPIFFENHIYGVRPEGQLACLDTDGKILWTSGPNNRYGLGAFLLANGLLYVVNSPDKPDPHDGWMTLVEATPKAFNSLATAKVLDGHEAWGPIALANGRMLVRDLTHLVCLDVREAAQ